MAAPMLTSDELSAAKDFIRPDADDDRMVTSCVLAARYELAQAGVSLPDKESPRRSLYDLVCHSMALGSYDQRDPLIVGTIVAENPVLQRKINQLKWTEPE